MWVNAASPTAVAVRLLDKPQAVDATTPRWRLERGRRSVIWHDARTQGLPAGVDHGVLSVPLIVDGHRARLDGELRRFPAPSLWLWLGALACVLAGGAAPMLLGRRDLARAEAKVVALVAAGASVVIAFAFALDSYASASASARYGRHVAFLAADTNDSAGDARTFLAQHPVSYPSYQTTTTDLASLAAIEGLPTTIFINPTGKVAYVHIGQYDTQGTLDQDIRTYAHTSSTN